MTSGCAEHTEVIPYFSPRSCLERSDVRAEDAMVFLSNYYEVRENAAELFGSVASRKPALREWIKKREPTGHPPATRRDARLEE
ncbi:hypothetical protein D3C87_1897550 [compost metagenome]